MFSVGFRLSSGFHSLFKIGFVQLQQFILQIEHTLQGALLEALLQQLLQDDDDDDELADVLMEDQAIYPVGGQMDLGELVAQLFWLQLDPYPKKPGTQPVRRSISG